MKILIEAVRHFYEAVYQAFASPITLAARYGPDFKPPTPEELYEKGQKLINEVKAAEIRQNSVAEQINIALKNSPTSNYIIVPNLENFNHVPLEITINNRCWQLISLNRYSNSTDAQYYLKGEIKTCDQCGKELVCSDENLVFCDENCRHSFMRMKRLNALNYLLRKVNQIEHELGIIVKYDNGKLDLTYK